jgi:hypothetical protein
VNIFRTLRAILRDAHGKGAMADDPVKGVQEPEYVREKVVIPSLAHVKKALTAADEDLALGIVMMVGCGLRNGEARAVNVYNVVADDVYRVHEQIHSNTHKPAKLKHRKAGEFREVLLPRSVREAMERYEEKYGTTKEGYLLRGPSGYYTEPMERRVCRGSSRTSPRRTVSACTASGTTSPRTRSGAGYRSPTWPNGWGTSPSRRRIGPTGTWCRGASRRRLASCMPVSGKRRDGRWRSGLNPVAPELDLRSQAEIVQARRDWTEGTRFGEVKGYDGDPLPAPELPPVPLKPRGRTR